MSKPDKIFTLHTEYGDYKAMLKIASYANNNNLAIAVMVEEEDYPGCWEPWEYLTVNISDFPKPKENKVLAVLDTNNFPQGENLVAELGIAKNTGLSDVSGFCTYPIYEFNLTKLKEYDHKGYDKFLEMQEPDRNDDWER